MKNISIITLLCILSLSATPRQALADQELSPTQRQLREWLEPVSRQAAYLTDDTGEDALAALARFYSHRRFQPAWIDADGLRPSARILLQALENAAGEGLDARDYDLSDMAASLADPAYHSNDYHGFLDPERARLDMALTAVMLRYCTHLFEGRVQPNALPEARILQSKPRIEDLPGKLAAALNEDRLQAFLEELGPRHTQYAELKKALRQYRQIEASGGWPLIPAGSKLRAGDTEERVAALRRHLIITGDLTQDSSGPDDHFDTTLETALKKFQQRHGLEDDGVAGQGTLAALNVPVAERIIELELNMERWRWLPDTFGPRYLMVNIPAFELRLVEDETVVLSMRAIVGQQRRPTPLLSAEMTYLELNPYWNIPQKIAREDILPKIKSDPEYLNKQEIQVFSSWEDDAPELDPKGIDWTLVSKRYFPYRLRQVPTSSNALGRIKFMFPNPHSVYIHDTPGKSLFDKSLRIFSSGCVRVEDPLALAARLLQEQRWDSQRLEATLQAGERRTIVLNTPVPVYLFYFTAWTDADGTVHFREDVYHHDRQLYQALTRSSSKLYLCRAETEAGRPLGAAGLPQI